MKHDNTIKSAGILETKPMRELVRIYNENKRENEEPVLEFTSRAEAVQRILARLLEVQEERKKKDKRRKPVFFPVRSPVRAFRRNTLRAKIVEMLRKGTTIHVIGDTAGLNYQKTRDLLRKMHHASGYGMEEDGDGVIWLKVK